MVGNLTLLKASPIHHGKILLPRATWPISHPKASMVKIIRDNILIRISLLTIINKIGIINRCLTDQIQDSNISSINGKGSQINIIILNMQITTAKVNKTKATSKVITNNTLTTTTRMVQILLVGEVNLIEDIWTTSTVPRQNQNRAQWSLDTNDSKFLTILNKLSYWLPIF